MKSKLNVLMIVALMACFAGRALAAPPDEGCHTARAVLNSGVVDTACYDLVEHTLTIVFQSGARYVYLGVPEDVFSGLVNADKPGCFFVKHVRNQYLSRRLHSVHAGALAGVVEPETAW